MPTTIAFSATSATPDSVVFQVTNDGVADFFAPPEISKANLLAALTVEGPLKELIRRTADLTALDFAVPGSAKADFIRLTRIAGGLNASLTPPLSEVVLYFSATGLVYSISDAQTPCQLLVEMRAIHGTER
jgi:hypothetical protein